MARLRDALASGALLQDSIRKDILRAQAKIEEKVKVG
jgi:hypothetical protein